VLLSYNEVLYKKENKKMDKRSLFIAQSLKIAETIREETRRLKDKHQFGDLPAIAMATFLEKFSLLIDGSQEEDLSLPKIEEILIFGSLAKGSQNPGDIDMMLGWFSDFFSFDVNEEGIKDEYLCLEENLAFLFEGFFGIKLQGVKVKVDLHILPISVLFCAETRAKILKRHKDKDFFKNVFSDLLKYDFTKNEFMPITLAELVAKYKKE